MSTELSIDRSGALATIDPDTRLGALKREVHWSLVVAATGGGLTYTLVGHVMEWSPVGFAVHGVAGLLGGYLVGTGIARVVTGMRVRALTRRYQNVSLMRRVVSSGLRVTVGAMFLAFSYLFAVGLHVSTFDFMELLRTGSVFVIWGVVLGGLLIKRIVTAMR